MQSIPEKRVSVKYVFVWETRKSRFFSMDIRDIQLFLDHLKRKIAFHLFLFMSDGYFSLFALLHVPGCLGDGAIHGGERLGEEATVADSHTARLQGA